MPAPEKIKLIEKALPHIRRIMEDCALCGNACQIDRLAGERGVCKAAAPDIEHAEWSSTTLHFGEEPMLVGRGGSGAIFFTRCNLKCVFCQNFQISQMGMGDVVHYRDLVRDMLGLQKMGAENINLVTPTHYIYPILLALKEAMEAGLSIPIVYNTNAFDSVELLRQLEGIVDIYLPDLKYMDAVQAERYSNVKNYPDTARQALLEMHRQVGNLVIENDVAVRGVILRHLILPNNIAGSYDLLLWLKDAGLTGMTIGLMSQYSPQNRAHDFPFLSSPLDSTEYHRIVDFALDLGFDNLLVQGMASAENYLPDFTQSEPFADSPKRNKDTDIN